MFFPPRKNGWGIFLLSQANDYAWDISSFWGLGFINMLFVFSVKAMELPFSTMNVRIASGASFILG